MYAKYFKRVIDFVLSLIGLIVLSPIFLILIVLGAIFMKGNPFFTQQRPGKNEKIFRLIKFRTMDNRKDKDGKLLPDEVRLNKYGRFLRSTSLDELPELFNILKGDMAIVGPRPLLVSYLPWYTEKERHRHATKVFNTIEGGAVCYKDDAWVQLLNDQKNFGIHGPESVAYVGGNAKMNEFQAAMGICNMRHLGDEIAKRKRIVERYREHLDGVEGIKLSIIQKDVESNYAYFPVVFDGYKYTRNEVFEKLAEEGINARKYFFPLTNSFECYRNYPTAGTEKTPVAQHIALRVLTLPMYADLSLEDVDRICSIILK